MSAPTTELAALLAAHQYVPSGLRGVSKCACGIPFHGMPHDHRAHVAAEVTAWMTTKLAAAETVEAVAEAIADVRDEYPRRADDADSEDVAAAALGAVREVLITADEEPR